MLSSVKKFCKVFGSLAILFSVVLCLGGCAKSSGATADDGINKYEECMRPDTTFRNLGNIDYADIICLTSRITNNGDKAVRILNVSTNCSCIRPTYDTEPAQPGETKKIRFEFDTHGIVGKQYHLVTIETDNGQTIKICLYANILEPTR